MIRKLPSLSQFLTDAKESFHRFPLPLLCAFVAGILAVRHLDLGDEIRDSSLWRYILCALLGIPAFLAVDLIAEARQWTRTTRAIAQFVVLGLLTAYCLTLPGKPEAPISVFYRYLALSLAAHALVSFLPFLRDHGVQRFWEFNKCIFLRLFTATLFSGVLTAGLMIALAACDYLLGFDVKPKNYGEVFALIACFFHPWFFLAGVPSLAGLQTDEREYPKGLKIFAQFILMSLVIIYLVILYAYELKIAINAIWPKGLVAQLVLWYAVVGILSLLLLWPLRDREGSQWVRRYTRLFFWTIVPLVVLLFLAIFVRVGDYGITVNRHVVISLAAGLAIVTIYFILSRSKDIRSIPLVLTVIALLSAYGPLSAASISASSQLGRLQRYLAGAPEPKGEANVDAAESGRAPYMTGQDAKSSIVRYVVDWHGMASFRGMFSDSAYTRIDSLGRSEQPEAIAKALGFEYSWYRRDGQRFVFLHAADCGMIGSDGPVMHVVRFNLMQDRSAPKEFRNALATYSRRGDSCLVGLHDSTALVQIIFRQDGAAARDSVQLDLAPAAFALLKAHPERADIPCEEMTVPVTGQTFTASLVIDHLNGSATDSTFTLNDISGMLLLGRK